MYVLEGLPRGAMVSWNEAIDGALADGSFPPLYFVGAKPVDASMPPQQVSYHPKLSEDPLVTICLPQVAREADGKEVPSQSAVSRQQGDSQWCVRSTTVMLTRS